MIYLVRHVEEAVRVWHVEKSEQGHAWGLKQNLQQHALPVNILSKENEFI